MNRFGGLPGSFACVALPGLCSRLSFPTLAAFVGGAPLPKGGLDSVAPSGLDARAWADLRESRLRFREGTQRSHRNLSIWAERANSTKSFRGKALVERLAVSMGRRDILGISPLLLSRFAPSDSVEMAGL